MTAALVTESAAATIRAMSSPIDKPALDAAMRRFPLLLDAIRRYCPRPVDTAPMMPWLHDSMPAIIREYRLILAKERG